jgi:DNA-binding GntR family transcriptional regulator
MKPDPLDPLDPLEHVSLQEGAYRVLRAAIVSNKYQPGQRLREASLARALGISRMPVREALRRLQQEGLVELVPRRGVFVAAVTLQNAQDIYRAREALESVAAALAAERASAEDLTRMERILAAMDRAARAGRVERVIREARSFHLALHESAHSPRVQAILEQVYAQSQRFRDITLRTPQRPRVAGNEHRLLLDAIRQRDPELAERRMRDHVRGAFQIAREQLMSSD